MKVQNIKNILIPYLLIGVSSGGTVEAARLTKRSPLTEKSSPLNNLKVERLEYVKNFDYIFYSSFKLHPKSEKLNKRSAETRILQKDSFIIELYGYNKTFCLHLHPSPHLLHPDIHKKMDLPVYPYSGYVVAVKDDKEMNQEYWCDWRSDSVSNRENYASNQDNWARLIMYKEKNKSFKSFDFRPLMGAFKQDILKLASIDAEDVPVYEGSFVWDDELYLIKTTDSLISTDPDLGEQVKPRQERHPHHFNSEMVLFKYKDIRVKFRDNEKESLIHESGFCGMEELDWNKHHAHDYYEGLMKQLDKFTSNSDKDVPANPLLKKRSKAGCPTVKKVLYTMAVADCSYITVVRGEDTARANIINAWNTVSAVYETTFNIYIGLLDIKMFTPCKDDSGGDTSIDFNRPCSNSYTINNRLSDFSKWRATQQSDAGLFHLLSNCSTGATVGLAWLNMVCTTDSFSQQNSAGGTDYVSGTGVSTQSNAIFMTIAHEIGHNFGGTHDCTTSQCQSCGNQSPCSQCCACDGCDCLNSFIMNPTNNVPTQNPKFSECTQTTVCGKNQLTARCLAEPGSVPVINGFQCGNGIKEGDEECDCGQNCATDSCCFSNCTLKAGAVCSDSNEGCCLNCQVIPADRNQLCRESAGPCDVPEYCNGTAACPPDTFKPDGLKCSNETDELKCATGVCTSRGQQCRVLTPRTDVIGDCRLYSGQCALFCDTSEQGCIKVSSAYFLDGTPCGNEGVCIKKKCTKPDILGLITQWILENQNVAICAIIVIAIIFLYLGNKCLKNVRTEKDSALLAQARLQEDELVKLAEIEKQQRLKQRQMREQQMRGGGAPASNANNKKTTTVAKKTTTVQERQDPKQSAAPAAARRQSVGAKDKRISYMVTATNSSDDDGSDEEDEKITTMPNSLAKSAGKKSYLQSDEEDEGASSSGGGRRRSSQANQGGGRSFDPRSPLAAIEDDAKF